MGKRKAILNKSQVIGDRHVDAGTELIVKKETGNMVRVVILGDTGSISGFVNKSDIIENER